MPPSRRVWNTCFSGSLSWLHMAASALLKVAFWLASLTSNLLHFILWRAHVSLPDWTHPAGAQALWQHGTLHSVFRCLDWQVPSESITFHSRLHLLLDEEKKLNVKSNLAVPPPFFLFLLLLFMNPALQDRKYFRKTQSEIFATLQTSSPSKKIVLFSAPASERTVCPHRVF